MRVYTAKVPPFTDEERVEFTVDSDTSVVTFICEWWDGLWHCTNYLNNTDKRSCVLYPNTLYYPKDKLYSFKTVTDKAAIGFEDLSDLQIVVGIQE